jgi:anti-sigma B factor antagonist
MVTIEKRDKIDIASFNVNRINALIADDIRIEISKIFAASGSKVIVDLKGVHYIDSSGFGCFLSLARNAKSRYGIIKFARPEPDIVKLIETLYLHTILEVYPDLDSCIGSFR